MDIMISPTSQRVTRTLSWAWNRRKLSGLILRIIMKRVSPLKDPFVSLLPKTLSWHKFWCIKPLVQKSIWSEHEIENCLALIISLEYSYIFFSFHMDQILLFWSQASKSSWTVWMDGLREVNSCSQRLNKGEQHSNQR